MLKTIFLLFISLSWQTFASPPPPPADAVFKLTISALDPNTFILDWQIKPGYFLYENRIKLIEHEGSNQVVELAPIQLPKAYKKTDSQGGTFAIYREQLILPVTVLGHSPGEVLLDVRAQGCSDGGFCYPPKTTTIKLTIDTTLALTQAMLSTPSPKPPAATTSTATHKHTWDDTFSHHHWPITLVIFLGLGLLLSFTPCVLPMIPVLSGIIVGHGKTLSTRQAFLLSLSYVLSMSVTYAGVGAVVALMGQNLQLVMQSPWIITLFSFIFVLLALAMFNVYELRLPLSWQAALARISYNQATGHYAGAAIMGCLSTLILSPCVTAPLIGALSYIARTGNVLLGVSALFSLGFGMGIPLLLIGTSLGKCLPHAGRWMNIVKIFFGIVLLGVAVDLMSRVLPSLSLHTNVASTSSSFIVVNTTDQVRVARALALREGKPVMIDFYADWCRSCKIIEQQLHRDARIQHALKSFVVLKADITANDAASVALNNQFGVVAPPTFIFFNAKGQELDNLRLVGEGSSEDFLAALEAASLN